MNMFTQFLRQLWQWLILSSMIPFLVVLLFLLLTNSFFFQNLYVTYGIVLIMLFFFLCRDFRNYWNVASLEYVSRRIQRVNDVTEAMRRATKIDDLLETIVKNLTHDLRFDCAFVFLLNNKEDPSKLTGISSRDVGKNDFAKIQTTVSDKNILAKTVRNNIPYIVNDAENDFRVSEEVKDLLKLNHFVTVPLSSKGNTFGVLVVDQKRKRIDLNDRMKRKVTPKDLILLNIFTNQAAVAIENIRLFNQLEEVAIRDGLTGLYNRRYFDSFLGTELKRLARYSDRNSGLSIILADIDHFKNYNDLNGHQPGDRLLTELGKIIASEVRDVDIAARYGGEEFVIVLPSTSKKGALEFAERIRTKVEKHPFEYREKQPLGKVTLSLGVASYNEDGTREDEIVKKADDRLYQAKKTGRNRSC